MNYKDFSINDYIKDEYFQEWVYNASLETETFWKNFLANNPHKKEEVEEARQFLLALDFDDNSASDASIKQLKDRIDFIIDKPLSFTAPKITSVSKKKHQRKTVIGIIVVVVAMLLFLWLWWCANPI
jgi:transmembrane sensor